MHLISDFLVDKGDRPYATFARPKGAKDKKPRKKRTIRGAILRGVGTTALLGGGAALLGRGAILRGIKDGGGAARVAERAREAKALRMQGKNVFKNRIKEEVLKRPGTAGAVLGATPALVGGGVGTYVGAKAVQRDLNRKKKRK